MSRWKVVLLNARALACGVAVAAVLVSAYTWFDWSPGGMLTPAEAALFAAEFSAVIALLLLIFCVPLWLILERRGWARWPLAMGLGFVAPLIYSFLDDLLGGNSEAALGFVRVDNFAYALCGVAAGLVIWLTRPKPAAIASGSGQPT